MAAKSAYLENAVLSAALTNTSFQATPYLSLHTGAPGTTGANEVASSNGYTRVAGTFTVSGGTATLNADATFPAPSGSTWGTCSYAGVWDASTSGHFLYYILLSVALVTQVGIPPVLTASSLTVSET